MRVLVLLVVFLLSACGRPDTGPSAPIFEIILDSQAEPNPDFAGCWLADHTSANGVRRLQICIDLNPVPAHIVLSTPLENTAEIVLTQGGVSGDHLHAGTPLGAVRFEGELTEAGTIEGLYYQGTLAQPLVFTPISP